MMVLVFSRDGATLMDGLPDLRKAGFNPVGSLEAEEVITIAELRDIGVFVLGHDIVGDEAHEVVAEVLSRRPQCRLVRSDGAEWMVDQVIRTGH